MNRRTVFAVTREHAGGMTYAGWRQEADDGRRPKQKAHPHGRAANRVPQKKGVFFVLCTEMEAPCGHFLTIPTPCSTPNATCSVRRFLAETGAQKKDVTLARDLPGGYQKDRCFSCYAPIDTVNGIGPPSTEGGPILSGYAAELHYDACYFFPHTLARECPMPIGKACGPRARMP